MRRFALTLLTTLSLVGCGEDNAAPVLSPLVDQNAFVNVEMVLALSAADAEGDAVSFRFESGLEGITARASLQDVGPGRAVFRWTPIAADLGQQAFDFIATDGTSDSRATIAIEVGQSGEGTGSPVFVQPLGTGTTLDAATQDCLDVPIVVEDPDSPGVTITQEEPLITGAELNEIDSLSASWRFCPTPEQLETDDRYTLTLSADDFESPKTVKDYLIVIRQENKPDCPGEAPVVQHMPMDVSSVNDVTIRARVTDDIGIKYEPLFYYSETAPTDPIDVTQMTQLTMGLEDGDMMSGLWTVNVPNPVASGGPGSTAQLFYVIVAQDNDDTEGTCDHLTQEPTEGAYKISVENPGGGGGLGLCEECTADVQCGGDGDLCVFFDNAHHCFTQCTNDTDCEEDYYCSFSTWTSIDGAMGRQCIPDDFDCDSQGATCVDDSFEDNDSLSAAKPLEAGSEDLVSCPAMTTGDDEDWFEIVITADTRVDVSVAGGSVTDLDLALKDSAGTVIDKGDTLSSNETVTACLTAGTYYVHVFAFGAGENPYTLTYSPSSESCGGPMCSDDENEDDDDSTQARDVNLSNAPYLSTTQAICSMDDDWFEVPMFAGETLHASLIFAQANGAEDLDLLIYDANLTNLTGCSETTPLGCDSTNGQSTTDDEKLEWPITTTGTYYVVVHGWDGSENLYDVCIGLNDTHCPDP